MTERQRNESFEKLNARGEYELVEPIDTLVMEMIPEEGTLFGNLYPLGETAKSLAKKLSTKEAVLTATMVSQRLRALNIQGLVVKKKSIGSGGGSLVWQRTKAATELITGGKGTANGNGGGTGNVQSG